MMARSTDAVRVVVLAAAVGDSKASQLATFSTKLLRGKAVSCGVRCGLRYGSGCDVKRGDKRRLEAPNDDDDDDDSEPLTTHSASALSAESLLLQTKLINALAPEEFTSMPLANETCEDDSVLFLVSPSSASLPSALASKKS